MKTQAPSLPSLGDLRALTPARVGLGLSGASMPTRAWLKFALDHARARDAVHADFDVAAVMQGLSDLGLDPLHVFSRASDRQEYLRRPDLGRMLASDSLHRLTGRADGARSLALVIGDGLSPAAVNAHALELVRSLVPRLVADGIGIESALIASGARVALGDEIGATLDARMVIMLIGERPGLSVSDSLGAYLTFAPKVGLTDERRNCVSNIHQAGLSYDEAAFKIAWLIREGLTRELTGVALKDESGGRTPLMPAFRSS
jgi:ethanolamine ammonia-lyase small subunit